MLKRTLSACAVDQAAAEYLEVLDPHNELAGANNRLAGRGRAGLTSHNGPLGRAKQVAPEIAVAACRKSPQTSAVTPSEAAGQSTWMALDVPRPISAAERSVLTSLAAVVDEPLLTGQLAGLVVDGVCRCGCSSVRLRSDRPAVPAERIAELSSVGRDDYFAVRADGVGANASVDVVLHIIKGRVQELELFDTQQGEGYAVPVDELTGLSDLTVE